MSSKVVDIYVNTHREFKYLFRRPGEDGQPGYTFWHSDPLT